MSLQQRLTVMFLFLAYCILTVVWSKVLIDDAGLQTKPGENIELGERILQILDKLENNVGKLSANIRFSLKLSEFLIKEKVRFYEPTRYEAQTYFHIQQKLHELLARPIGEELTTTQKQILNNIFHKNVLLMRPALKSQKINVLYETNHQDLERSINDGIPNATFSDECLASIVTLDANKCRLRDDCLYVIITDLPTYGYQRLHQILSLYVFMHHECSMQYGTHATFELLAGTHCTQVYSEQRSIRERQLPTGYRDLYLEQNVICGLFGFVEFLNWHNMQLLLTAYTQINGCYCLPHATSNNAVEMDDACSCNNHINALALVYYVNGLLLLE